MGGGEQQPDKLPAVYMSNVESGPNSILVCVSTTGTPVSVTDVKVEPNTALVLSEDLPDHVKGSILRNYTRPRTYIGENKYTPTPLPNSNSLTNVSKAATKLPVVSGADESKSLNTVTAGTGAVQILGTMTGKELAARLDRERKRVRFERKFGRGHTIGSNVVQIGRPLVKDADQGNNQISLLQAIERRDPELAGLLLQNGADPNTPDDIGRRSLSRAIEQRYPELAELLLQNGADPNTPDDIGRRPHLRAIEQRYQQLAKLIFEKEQQLQRT